jgi:hypothetical protein
MNSRNQPHWIGYMALGLSAMLTLVMAGSAARGRIMPLELPNFYDIRLSGRNVVVFWHAGSLQTAPDLAGPWADVPNAKSPYTNSVAGTEREFYRLKIP